MKQELKKLIDNADAILIGAGSGLSAAAGLTYSGKRFEKYFADFQKEFGIQDMYSGGFYPFSSSETYWAWWSRHIWINRYETETNDVYKKLFELVKDKNYFVLTTNVDHQFQIAGFDKKRLFYTQGDYGLLQCSAGCHQKTYDNKATVEKMIQHQHNMKIPSELIPRCPVCGKPMVPNLRCDDTFVQDEFWYAAAERYENFINQNKKSKLLLLEMGVGMNTPGIIKYPFWQITSENPDAFYVAMDFNENYAPPEIQARSLLLDGDIAEILE